MLALLSVGSRFEMHGQQFEIVATGTSVVTLTNLDDSQFLTVPRDELARYLEVPIPDRLGNAQLVESVPDLRVPDLMALDIREVVTGQRTDGNTTPRKRYDPAKHSLPDRERAKIKELNTRWRRIPTKTGRPKTISLRTIQRKVKRFLDGGILAVLDGRKLSRTDPSRAVQPIAAEAFRRAIQDRVGQSTASMNVLLSDFRRHMKELDPSYNGWTYGKTTNYKYVHRIGKGRYPLGPATTREQAANQPDRMYAVRRTVQLGRCQIDNSGFGIMALDHRDKARRVELTAMKDEASHSYAAAGIRFGGTKSFDHILLLANSAVPRSQRPIDEHYLELLQGNVWESNFEDILVDGMWPTLPFIRTQELITDRGRDFESAPFESACSELKISHTFAAVRTPTDKPMIEHGWETIEEDFAAFWPGYVGRNPQERGAKAVDPQSLLPIGALLHGFEFWLAAVYQNTEIRTLTHPMFPGVKFSPNTLYSALSQFNENRGGQEWTADTFIRLMPADWRAVGREGIHFRGRRYDSPLLDPLRNIPSPYAHQVRKWPFRYHPYEPTHIWLEKPDHTWITCDWMERNLLLRPFGPEIYGAALNIQRNNPSINHEQAAIFTAGIAAAAKQAAKENATKEARRAAVAELAPMPRLESPLIKAMPNPEFDPTRIPPAEVSLFNPDEG